MQENSNKKNSGINSRCRNVIVFCARPVINKELHAVTYLLITYSYKPTFMKVLFSGAKVLLIFDVCKFRQKYFAFFTIH